jgi:hypothetical protein
MHLKKKAKNTPPITKGPVQGAESRTPKKHS